MFICRSRSPRSRTQEEVRTNRTMKRVTNNPTPLSLTKDLISFNTSDPPGHEEACAKFLGNFLEDGGFAVGYYELAQGRLSIIATITGGTDKPPLCFSGHIDTVPFDESRWSKDPLGGETADGKIFGRGTSDMKAGIAAMVVAALRLARMPKRSAGIKLAFTAGEEAGCQGARYLVQLKGVLGDAGALVVGEPTSNYPLVGHKGAYWLEAHTSGATAHGSMPHRGDNAIYKAARAITRLEQCTFDVTHPVMGSPTINVGTITGGTNINVVPDHAVFGIDLRTVRGQKNSPILESLQSWVGSEVELRPILDAPSIFTDPTNDWVQEVFAITEQIIGEHPVPRCATYFTDASVLTPALGNPPTIILGPGEASMAHRSDEFCHISRIEEAVEAYFAIGQRWLDG